MAPPWSIFISFFRFLVLLHRYKKMSKFILIYFLLHLFIFDAQSFRFPKIFKRKTTKVTSRPKVKDDILFETQEITSLPKQEEIGSDYLALKKELEDKNKQLEDKNKQLEDKNKQLKILHCSDLYRSGYQIFNEKYCKLTLKKPDLKCLGEIMKDTIFLWYYSSCKNPGQRKWQMEREVYPYFDEWSNESDIAHWRSHLTSAELLEFSEFREKYNSLPLEPKLIAFITWLVKTDEWKPDTLGWNGRLDAIVTELKILHCERNTKIVEIVQGILQGWYFACKLNKKYNVKILKNFEPIYKEFIKWYETEDSVASDCAQLFVKVMEQHPVDTEEFDTFLAKSNT